MPPHFTRTPYFPTNLEDYAPWVAAYGLNAPYGECQCGCREATNVATRNRAEIGNRVGQPQRFIQSHNRLGAPQRELMRGSFDDGACNEIPLTKGKAAIVDAADYEWLMQWNWYATKPITSNTFYAVRKVSIGGRKQGTVFMHRLILGVSSEMHVDHIDGNGLNNQRDNLRLCTHLQNMHNRQPDRDSGSRFKGVSRVPRKTVPDKWQATIVAHGKQYYLGVYDLEEEAALAYNEAAMLHFGEFAWVNAAK